MIKAKKLPAEVARQRLRETTRDLVSLLATLPKCEYDWVDGNMAQKTKECGELAAWRVDGWLHVCEFHREMLGSGGHKERLPWFEAAKRALEGEDE